MSFLNDVATLIKAGYTKEDVKELYNLEKQTETSNAEAQPEAPKTEDTTQTQDATEKATETVTKEITQPDAAPDFEALYKAEQEKVKALQNKNNQADLSKNNNTSQSDLVDLVRTYC